MAKSFSHCIKTLVNSGELSQAMADDLAARAATYARGGYSAKDAHEMAVADALQEQRDDLVAVYAQIGIDPSEDALLNSGATEAKKSNAETDATLARTKERSEVRFTTPYVGPTGVKLTGYVWPNKKEEYIDNRGEDRVRTVSDWEAAVTNLETGRQIVHQFFVEKTDGTEHQVSAESAAVLLGIAESTVRSNAKKLLEREIKREKDRIAAIASADKVDEIDAAESPAEAVDSGIVFDYALNAPMIRRMQEKGRGWKSIDDRIERESASRETYRFMERDGKYIWTPNIINEGSELAQRGWKTVELRAMEIWPAEQQKRIPMKGDRFKDAQGKEWEIWNARSSLIEAFPVVDGKIRVNNQEGQRFATDDRAKFANPEARTDYFPLPKAKPIVTPQTLVGDPENYIKVAADSIKELRKIDVYRVLVESNRPEFRVALADYIKSERPDLADEVADVLAGEVGGGVNSAYMPPKNHVSRAMIHTRDFLSKFADDNRAIKEQQKFTADAEKRFGIERIAGYKGGLTVHVADRDDGNATIYLQGVGGNFVEAGTIPLSETAVYGDIATEPSEEPLTAEKIAESLDAEKIKAGYRSLPDIDGAIKGLYDGTLSPDDYKAAFRGLMSNKDAIIAELNALTKDQIYERVGKRFYGGTEKKVELVDRAFNTIRNTFALRRAFGPTSYTMGSGMLEKFEADKLKALTELVDASTADDLKAFADEVAGSRAKVKEKIEAAKDPKTLDDFETALRLRNSEGMTYAEARMSLTPEQRATYDELLATQTRDARQDRADQQKTEVRVAGQTTGAQIVEGKHSKHGYQLWSVQLADKVDGDSYRTLLTTAKRMGGNYVNTMQARMWKTVWGFQFRDLATAEAFMKLAAGDTSAAKDVIQERRDAFDDDKSQSAVDRLREMADAMESAADASLSVERKSNTARRARFAAAAEAGANDAKAMAQTMRNIAQAIEDGSAKFLDRVRTKVQIQMLNSMVGAAQWEYWSKKYPSYAEQERHTGERPTPEVADYVKFPYYTAYRSDLARMGRRLLEIDGAKLLGQRLLKVADDVTEAYKKFAKENLHKVSTFKTQDGKAAAFRTAEDAEAAIVRSGYKGKATTVSFKRGEHLVIMGPEMAKEAGLWHGDPDKQITLTADDGATILAKAKEFPKQLDVPYTFANVAEKQARLKAMGIETPAELRAMLREFIGMKEAPKAPDRVKELERAMAGKRNTDGLDFFPTPASAVQAMLDAAEIESGMRVLEPSAGMGHIAEKIRDAGVEPDVVELSNERKELLEAKGFNVVGRDFMEVTGKYDRIIMNPPFSDRRDAEHVRHAYTLLAPGGRVVAIMGEGSFFGQDKKAQDFRDWLESVGGTSEKLDEGTFLDPSLPVNTGVNARMVVIDKGRSSDAVMFNAKSGPRGNPLDAAALEATIGRVISGSPSHFSRDTVVTAPLFADLPAPILAKAKKEGYDANGRKPNGEKLTGATYDGKVYLVQENISSELEAEETLLHERVHQIVHGNAKDKNGIALRQSLGRLYLRLGAKSGIERMAKEAGVDISGPLAAFPNVSAANRHAFLAEELLAHAEGQRAYERLPAKIKRAAQEFWGEFRDWLRTSKFVRIAEALGAKLSNFTQSDLAWTLKGVRQQEAGAGSKAIRFMTAWHGSPHDHDRFDLSKIGTGEGAQAYGWGLYFAGSRDVAEFYREKLASGYSLRGKKNYEHSTEEINAVIKIGRLLAQGSQESMAINLVKAEAKRDVDNAKKLLDERTQNLGKEIDTGEGWGDLRYQTITQADVDASADGYERAQKRLEVIEGINVGDVAPNKGRLYKVDLAPAEDEYLLWDSPLSEQSDKVKAALKSLIDEQTSIEEGDSPLWKMSWSMKSSPEFVIGRQIYTVLAYQDGQKAASEYLLSIGIRGIKYLDGNSRNSQLGEGTYNYVIFDDADVKIVGKESRQSSSPVISAERARYQAVVDKFVKRFKGASALDIRLVSSRSEIPERYRPSPFAEGVYHSGIGTVWLITDNLTLARANQVLLHEVIGHYGLASMMGELFAGLLPSVKRVARAKATLVDDTLQPGDADYATWEAVKLRYPEASESELAQEVLARMAETEPDASMLAYVRAVIRKWLREVARALGVDLDVSATELNDLLILAAAHVRRGDNLITGTIEPEVVAASKARTVVQTETPEFKRWFGDWEAAANARPLRTATTLDEARSAAAEFIGVPLENASTGLIGTVSKTNLGKMSHSKAGDKSVSMHDHALAIANIDQLFRAALLDDTHADRKGEPTIRAMHRFVAPMIGRSGDVLAVKLTVKETTGPNEPNPIYTVEAMEMQSPPSVLSRANPDVTGIRPQAGFSSNVQQRLDAVKKASKVVDAEGKPLVVYHGTDADFTEFKPSESGVYGGGVYFTKHAGNASSYGKNTVAAYLSLNNPIVTTRKEAREIMARKGGTQQWAKDARAAGYDGVYVSDVDFYIAFRPEQIKSAIGNNGSFDPSNPSILESRAAQSALPLAGGQSAAQSAWDIDPDTRLTRLIYKFQDKHVDTKDLVEAIEASRGQQTADSFDPYLAEELYHKRTATRVDAFADNELKPLLNAMRLARVGREEFEQYLHARHAQEANQIIRDRDGMADGGSGMLDADAQTYLSGLDPAKRLTYERLARQVDAIIAKTRQTLVDYGLESQDTIDAWARMFQHYVPLNREDMETGTGIGQGFSVRGPASKSRTGSSRQVVDILANIAQQRDRAIVRGEKNRVATALYGLAYLNPNKDVWQAGIVPTKQVVVDGKIATVPDHNYKNEPNVVVARIKDRKGQVHDRAIVFNRHNDRAMRLAGAMKNLDAPQMGELMNAAGKITRYLSAINTQYNPVFVFVNLMRDVQSAMFNLSSTPLAGMQKEVAGHTASALRGIFSDLRAHRAGQQPSSVWAQLYEEMQREGGTTGYRDMFGTAQERSAEQIDKLLDPDWWAKTKWGKALTAGGMLKAPEEWLVSKPGKALFNLLSDANETSENAIRLAVYKTAIDHGMSKARAASLAKNISVNFNRKGQLGSQMNSLYAFFNAAVQGTARLAETLRSPAGKQIMSGGVLLGMVQALALAAAFDDDDPPDFVRERNLIIPVGGKRYVTVPMPLGLHVLPNVGRIPMELVLRGFKKPGKAATDFLSVFAEAFNPIGNAGMSWQTLTPSVIDPAVALLENKDWSGRPIARQSFDKNEPGHLRTKDTASPFGKFMARAINAGTGGTEYTAGALSPSPDQLDYLIGQATGGVGREASKAFQAAGAIRSGEDLPPYKVPLIGRMYGKAEGKSHEGNKFYANLDEVDRAAKELKGRRVDGGDSGEYAREHPEAFLGSLASRTKLRLTMLQRQKEKAMEAGNREAVKAVEEQMTQAMLAFNERYDAVTKETSTAD